MKRRQMMSEVNATHTKNTEKACWAEERRLLPTSQAEEEEEEYIIRCFIREVVTKMFIVHFTFSHLIALFV